MLSIGHGLPEVLLWRATLSAGLLTSDQPKDMWAAMIVFRYRISGRSARGRPRW